MVPIRNQTPSQARRRAILFVLGSSASFAAASGLVKVAAPEIPTVELMLFRSFVAFLCLIPLIVRGGGWSVLHTRRPLSHAMRSAAGLGGMFGTFYGLAHLPIAAVTALGFAMPIVLAMLSVPMLQERLTPARMVSIVAGLLGVLLVVRPWRAPETALTDSAGGLPLFETGVVLAGVAAWALAMASIRRMGQSGERNVTIVVLFSLCCTLATLVLTVPVWVTPRLALWPVLIGIGAISAGAQLLMTEGYRSGEASMLAPFEYSAIFYTVLLGWTVWGEVPGAWEAAGMAVLVISGLFTWWREGRS
jgi:drug/metabolite transporter (DMT)-like permease